MRTLAGSLVDGVLADAILIPPRQLIPPTNIRKLRVLRKSTETSTKKKHLLVNEKGDVGMAKCFSKKYGNKGSAFNHL